MKFKFGLIGLGKMGKAYFDVISQIKDFEISSICDTDERKRIDNVSFFKDYREMPTKDLDAIIISTSSDSHFNILNDVSKDCDNILIEKPVCNSSEEAEKLNKLSGKKIAVGYLTRFSPVIEEAKRFMSHNLLRPYRFEIKWIKDRSNDTRGHIGVIRQETTHPLDLIMHSFIGTKDISVSEQVYLNYKVDELPHETDAQFSLKIGNQISRFNVSYEMATSKRHISVYCRSAKNGDEYCVFLGFDKIIELGVSTDRMAVYHMNTHDWYNFDNGVLTKTYPGKFKESKVNKLREQIYAFERWISNGLYDYRICSLDQAIRNVKLCDKILEQGKKEDKYVKL